MLKPATCSRPARPSGLRSFADLSWALITLCACQLNINGIPLAPSDPPPMDPPKDAGDAEPQGDHEGGLARSDGGVEPADAGRADGGELRSVRHADCALAVPLDAAEPVLKRDPTGRPSFDRWRDLECSDLPALETCAANPGGCRVCLPASSDAGQVDAGLCAYAWDTRCELDAVTTYRPSRCLLCESSDWKARACCDGAAPGLDCRAWPYPADSSLGELCARHADCEPGLLCKVPADTKFGVCTCPEASPAPASCITPS